MDCREARDLLQEELDGRLPPADAARLAAHVAACAACAEEKRGLASLRATFRATPRPNAPAGFRDDVMSSLPKGRLLKLPTVFGWIAAVAAVLVVVVTLIPGARSGAPVEREVATATSAADSAKPPAARAPAEPNFEPHKSRADEKEVVAEEDAAAPKPAPTADAESARRAMEESKKAPGTKSDAAPQTTTRYVVFRDARAAEQFAKDLATADAPAPKDKAAPATGLLDGSKASGGAAGPAPAPRDERAADVSQGFASSVRRIVARTSIAVPSDEAALAARVTRAGGTLVPAADTSKFAATVEPPVGDKAGEDRKKSKSLDDDGAKAEAPAAEGAFREGVATAAPPRVVIVIVVLDAPSGPR